MLRSSGPAEDITGNGGISRGELGEWLRLQRRSRSDAVAKSRNEASQFLLSREKNRGDAMLRIVNQRLVATWIVITVQFVEISTHVETMLLQSNDFRSLLQGRLTKRGQASPRHT